MLKRAIAKSIHVNIADVDCSHFTSCMSCIAQEGCGFCGTLGQCVSGGWFGALDKSISCGLNDYYYHQCHMSTLPLVIITIVLISIVLITILISMSIFCCCLCCCQRQGEENEDEQEEDTPLLGYLRRSSTYYQWNRPIPPPIVSGNKKKSNEPPPNKSSSVAVEGRQESTVTQEIDLLPESLPSGNEESLSWCDRRSALIKKYARESSSSPTIE